MILTCPVGIRDGIEATNLLATGIIFDEGHIAGDKGLAIFFSNLLFLLRDWLRAVSATVVDYMLHITNECRMTMKLDISVIGFIPLCI